MRKEISSKLFLTLMASCLVALFLALVVPNALAQTWQSVPIRTKAQKTAGLLGGEGMQIVFALAYAPTNGNTVYGMTDTSNVWKSTDGGTNWQRKSNGFGASGGVSITVSPYDENVVVIAGSIMTNDGKNIAGSVKGIFVTTDGGERWLHTQASFDYTKLGGHNGGNPIAFAGSKVLYAGTFGQGLHKSTDTGASWQQIDLAELNNDTILDVRVHPDDSSVLFVSSKTDGKLYKLTGGGSQITQIGTSLPAVPNLVQISSNKNASPTDDTVFAAVREHGVYRSTNSGLTFSPINSGIDGINDANSNTGIITTMVMSPQDNNYLYIASRYDQKVYYSHNALSASPTWSKPSTMDVQNADGWVVGTIEGKNYNTWANYYISPLAAHPSNRNIALIGADCNVVRKTVDGGINWRYSNSGWLGGNSADNPINSSQTSIAFDPNNSKRFILNLVDYGPYFTEDDGDTFRHLGVPTYDPNPNDVYNPMRSTRASAISPFNGNVAIIAAGNWDAQQLVLTRNLSASSPAWTVVIGTGRTHNFIAFHPTKSNIAYAGTFRFANILNDSSFSTLGKTVVNMYPGNGDIVYAIGPSDPLNPNTSNTRIFKSLNGGDSWTNPYPDLPHVFKNTRFGSIEVSPSNPDKLYIAVPAKGVYVLTTTAASLKNSQHGLANDVITRSAPWPYSLAVDFKNPNIVYAGYWSYLGVTNGIFRSTNGGDTWENINGNLGSRLSMAGIRVHPLTSYVYAGSWAGTWKLPPPGTVDATAPAAPTGLKVVQ